MICYRDMTFCTDTEQCANNECSRRITEQVKEGAKRTNLPIAQGSFKDHCDRFVEVKNEKD